MLCAGTFFLAFMRSAPLVFCAVKKPISVTFSGAFSRRLVIVVCLPEFFMTLLEVLAIAVALSMDAFAVCVTTGVTLRKLSPGPLIRMPLAFGFFQFMMPLIGWFMGANILHLVEKWDHWLACGLLFFVGGKLIWDTVTGSDDEEQKVDPTAGWTIIVLAVATSIDALAVGFSFAMLQQSILWPSAVIGIVCTIISVCGMLLGACIGRIETLRRISGIAGGLALLAIGVLILRDHGVF